MAKRARKRHIWADDEKRMICRQAQLPRVSVSEVARRHDVNANLVLTWLRDGRFVSEEADPPIEALAVQADAPATFLSVELVEEPEGAPPP
jgi:transposase